MTYPPDDHRASVSSGTSIEHDRRIINGSMLAVAAFVIVAIGIAWYALTDNRSGTASINPPAAERRSADSTTGYGGARPRAPAPNPAAK
jgi:hypothetical protein